jgi:hypothetical protein
MRRLRPPFAMNTKWLQEMLEEGFAEILENSDPATEDEVMERVVTRIRHRAIREYNEALDRIKQKTILNIEREREEVQE